MFATLFGRRKKIETPPKRLERPQARRLTVSDETRAALAEYDVVAKQLGFKPAEVRQEELKLFLADNAIPVYNGMQVHRYLGEQAAAQGKTYDWIPLREEDRGLQCVSSAEGWARSADGYPRYYCGRIRAEDGPYTQIVPLSVMQTIRKILESFPDAHFFVSEIGRHPDPFLGTAINQCQLLVVDFWNEPGFKPI